MQQSRAGSIPNTDMVLTCAKSFGMATTIRQPATTDQVIALDISWQAYEALCAGLDESRSARLAYDGATLEIMSPGSKHERICRRFGLLLAVVMTEWNINIASTGSTRFARESLERGFEADESAYIASAPRVRDWDRIDISVDPPPDLVIELDVANSRSDKQELYARLGIAEFWRYSDRAALEAFALAGATYEAIRTSRVVPGLPIAQIASRLTTHPGDDLSAIREWRDWLRSHMP